MCGIAGLFLKNTELEPQLGHYLAGMLETLTGRGPDSAGFALYGAPASREGVKLTLRLPAGMGATGLGSRIGTRLGFELKPVVRDDHAVIIVPPAHEEAVRLLLAEELPGIAIAGSGHRMELYKGVGLPAEVSDRFGLAGMSGSHAVGHTRMATESAVTIAGAHPFSTGRDQCLVHNGSLSNHNALRRNLTREGIRFETDNDSEVAAGYLSLRMREGARLDQALDAALSDLDGFYTFVVGTENGFGVLRDPVACKPAVMAETDDYVAFGSEYRTLTDLPGIEHAHIFEPEPAKVYFWERTPAQGARA